jgi:hypothetical protein
MKIAQLRASPCLTPLSIFIDSLANPFIKILAVIITVEGLKNLDKAWTKSIGN